jgi:hypothetical protein
MAGCSVFLELNKDQLAVIAKVFGSECSAVQITSEHQTGPVLKYGMPVKVPPDVHTLYGIPIPGKRQVGIHLTNEQKEQLGCAGVKHCDYVEVEPIGLRYGIVVPHVLKYGMPPPTKSK